MLSFFSMHFASFTVAKDVEFRVWGLGVWLEGLEVSEWLVEETWTSASWIYGVGLPNLYL